MQQMKTAKKPKPKSDEGFRLIQEYQEWTLERYLGYRNGTLNLFLERTKADRIMRDIYEGLQENINMETSSQIHEEVGLAYARSEAIETHNLSAAKHIGGLMGQPFPAHDIVVETEGKLARLELEGKPFYGKQLVKLLEYARLLDPAEFRKNGKIGTESSDFYLALAGIMLAYGWGPRLERACPDRYYSSRMRGSYALNDLRRRMRYNTWDDEDYVRAHNPRRSEVIRTFTHQVSKPLESYESAFGTMNHYYKRGPSYKWDWLVRCYLRDQHIGERLQDDIFSLSVQNYMTAMTPVEKSPEYLSLEKKVAGTLFNKLGISESKAEK
jgi:hypothetical protein